MQNNNPRTEIGAIIVSVVIIVGATTLVILNKINYIELSEAYLLAVGVFAGNLALKAPSPAQQANMQQLVSDLTTALGVLFQQHTHAPAPAPPVVAPAQQTANVPPQPIPAAAAQSPVPQPPTSTLPWTGLQQPFPPSSTFPLPVVPK